MANPILILHGWSDNYESFLQLKLWLCAHGYEVRDVFFGNYESMEDHVSFDDLADGLQSRFEEMALKGEMPALKPFSLDVIVHSTGGLVVRHWLHHYIQDVCKGDLECCPIQRLIMLAPANFGSRLAEQGKSGLAKLFKGGLAHGFETGKLILEGLELGSPDTWRIAENDLFAKKKLYRGAKGRGPFVFVFSGTGTYGDLKGFVAHGANEDGSDGTVRAAAASLNSIKIIADCSQQQPEAFAMRGNYDAFAFGLVPGKNHSEVVPSDSNDDRDPIFARIKQCLEVDSDAKYDALRTEFEAENDKFYAAEDMKKDDERVHRYQQFLVRVNDDMGNEVPDYRIDFHVVDETIAGSNIKDAKTLKALQKYQKLTQLLQDNVIVHVNKHSTNPSYRTFFINLDKLDELRKQIKAETAGAYIGMNLDAAGPTRDITYDTDRLRYLPVEIKIPDDQKGQVDFFKANTSTLVEMRLQRVQSKGIFEFLWEKKK